MAWQLHVHGEVTQCLRVVEHSQPVKVKERKTVSLKTRTLEEQIVAKRLREQPVLARTKAKFGRFRRYDRALARFAQQPTSRYRLDGQSLAVDTSHMRQEEWEKFRHHASRKLAAQVV